MDWDEAAAWARGIRDQNLTLVFTNGCFDLLHLGHIHLLERAASFGDRLIVGLNTDASVRRLKGPQRPLTAERDRARILIALRPVDGVVLFDEDTPLKLIQTLRPAVLVKGGDYRPETVVGRDDVVGWGGRVEIVPTLEGYSTTRLSGAGWKENEGNSPS
ncbi:MAG: D-glycero-beta-D-manno-heptose 1-phosphate adenylyltransferase [Candidatus Eisenbacteria bacterium]|uniref:D-glycero-beta-D-manno-heptose 1-phosphate adenylyltransferase n=1 Tax=Eiseniibacteriota bacterium TaxID=2212470 RepID=A0A948RW02_UNCEI|nr:D-glycero-beta-D-manno-heptose 1-phosphate adenylyltransferase [Candidatus Eisenbacteria bacterium]MBU1948931.1 D-glycero-beta-D-manno-heptose 1-phosphate adenylyltransferase [Candidatus Eisenbacteria bacterium]MBU2690583.1 D-glycero-beta-D-manno-heptose 1-phosphate adenylyltransferase [Candidatus Eisenbacteria bacterium]